MNGSKLFHYIGSERTLDDDRELIVKQMIDTETEWKVTDRDEIVCRKSRRKGQYYMLVTSLDHQETVHARVILREAREIA